MSVTYTKYKIFDLNGEIYRTYKVPQYILNTSNELRVKSVDLYTNSLDNYYAICYLTTLDDKVISLAINDRNNYRMESDGYILERINQTIISLGVINEN